MPSSRQPFPTSSRGATDRSSRAMTSSAIAGPHGARIFRKQGSGRRSARLIGRQQLRRPDRATGRCARGLAACSPTRRNARSILLRAVRDRIDRYRTATKAVEQNAQVEPVCARILLRMQAVLGHRHFSGEHEHRHVIYRRVRHRRDDVRRAGAGREHSSRFARSPRETVSEVAGAPFVPREHDAKTSFL